MQSFASALQPGELRVDQRRKRVPAAGRDRDTDMFGKVMERAPGLIQRGGLDLPECRDVLLQHGCAVRCGRAGNEAGVGKVHQRRLERAPSQVDDARVYQHELPGELSQAGNLLNEVILVEAAGSGLGVDLRICLRPGAWPVARQPDAGYTVRTALVHRALHRALEPPLTPGATSPALTSTRGQ